MSKTKGYSLFYKYYDKDNNPLDVSISDYNIIKYNSSILYIYIHNNDIEKVEVENIQISNDLQVSTNTSFESYTKDVLNEVNDLYKTFNQKDFSSILDLETFIKQLSNFQFSQKMNFMLDIDIDVTDIIFSQDLFNIIFSNFNNSITIKNSRINIDNIELETKNVSFNNVDIYVKNMFFIKCNLCNFEKIRFHKVIDNENEHLIPTFSITSMNYTKFIDVNIYESFRMNFICRRETEKIWKESYITISNVNINFSDTKYDKLGDSILNIVGYCTSNISNINILRILDKIKVLNISNVSFLNISFYNNLYRRIDRTLSEVNINKVSNIDVSNIVVSQIDRDNKLYMDPTQQANSTEEQMNLAKSTDTPIFMNITNIDDLSTLNFIDCSFDGIAIFSTTSASFSDIFIHSVDITNGSQLFIGSSTTISNLNIQECNFVIEEFIIDRDTIEIEDLNIRDSTITCENIMIETIYMSINTINAYCSGRFDLILLQTADESSHFCRMYNSILKIKGDVNLYCISTTAQMILEDNNITCAKYYDGKYIKVKNNYSEITANTVTLNSFEYISKDMKIKNDTLQTVSDNFIIKGFLNGRVYLTYNNARKFNIDINNSEYENGSNYNDFILTLDSQTGSDPVCNLKISKMASFITCKSALSSGYTSKFNIHIPTSDAFNGSMIKCIKNDNVLLELGDISDIKKVNYINDTKNQDLDKINWYTES